LLAISTFDKRKLIVGAEMRSLKQQQWYFCAPNLKIGENVMGKLQINGKKI
jgi:hypothetical protein